MKISVIIPVFRALPYIRETIASVISEISSISHAEVLIVDNHCDDGSVTIAMEMLQHAHVECRLLHESVRGPGAARNCGVAAARGEWIQFLDADDLLLPGKLRAQYHALDDLSSEVAFVHSQWCRGVGISGVDWGPVIESSISDRGEKLMTDLIGETGFVHLAAGLVRRSAFLDVGGFDEEMIEDVKLQLKLVNHGYVFYRLDLHRPGFLYRTVAGSLSRRDPAEFQRAVARNVFYVIDRLRQRQVLYANDPVIVRALSNVALNLSIHSPSEVEGYLAKVKLHGINIIAGLSWKHALCASVLGTINMLRLVRFRSKMRNVFGSK